MRMLRTPPFFPPKSGEKPNLEVLSRFGLWRDLGLVVQRLDNAIHRINHYLADSVVCFVNTYPLDSDLSGG